MRTVPLRGRASLFLPRPQSYLCVVEALFFSRDGVAVRFCLRGDGSMGPLQAPGRSKLHATLHAAGDAQGGPGAPSLSFSVELVTRDADDRPGVPTRAEEQQAGRETASGTLFFPLAKLFRPSGFFGSTVVRDWEAKTSGLSMRFAYGEERGGYSSVELCTLTPAFVRRERLAHFRWVARASGCGE